MIKVTITASIELFPSGQHSDFTVLLSNYDDYEGLCSDIGKTVLTYGSFDHIHIDVDLFYDPSSNL